MPGFLLLEDAQKQIGDRLGEFGNQLFGQFEPPTPPQPTEQTVTVQPPDDVVQRLTETGMHALTGPAEAGQRLADFGINLIGEGLSSLQQPEPTPAPAPAPTPTPSMPEDVTRPAPTPTRTAEAGGANPNPTPEEVRSYITQAAQQRGIDPNIALRVAQSEGGMEAARRGTFKTGSSWWPFQLHYGGPGYEQLGNVAGMGNAFTKETGFAPGDPKAWQAATDYALDRAKQGGWGAWYGARDQGITGFEGINRNAPDVPFLQRAGEAVGGAIRGAGEAVAGAVRDISQFGDKQLTSEEAYAACGPAAAVRFAQRMGRNPSLREALDMAKTVGWTAGQGMAGLNSERALMDKMGVETQLVPGAQWDRFAREAQTGNPVTISTSAHYFYADGYNPDTGQFHVGRSGTDLRGGKEWMTRDEIVGAAQRLGGGEVQGALFANNPVAPSNSTTAGMTMGPMEPATTGFTAPGGEEDKPITQPIEEGVQVIGQGLSGLGQAAQGGLTVIDDAVRNATQGVDQALGISERQAQIEANRPSSQGLTEDIGQEVLRRAELEREAPGQVYSAGGAGLADTVIGKAKDAGWQPSPQDEQSARQVLEQGNFGNIYLSLLTAGTGPAWLQLARAAASLGGAALGGEAAQRGAEALGAPEPVQAGAEVIGSLAGGIGGPAAISRALTPEAIEAAGRVARSRLPAEAEAGFAAGMPTGGPRVPGGVEPPEPTVRAGGGIFDLDELADMRRQAREAAPEQQAEKASLLEQIVTVGVNNMLGGTSGMLSNALSGATENVYRPFATAVVRGELGPAWDDVRAQGAAVGDALAGMAHTFRTGQRRAQLETTDYPEAFPGALGMLPFTSGNLRVNAAMDEFNSVLATAGGQGTELSRLARANPELDEFGLLDRFRSQIDDAGRAAQQSATFQSGGFLGIGEAIAGARRKATDPTASGQDRAKGILATLLVPFSKIPDAIITRGVLTTPGFAEARAAVDITRGLKSGDPATVQRAVRQWATTEAVNSAIAFQALRGNITGNGPEDKAKRDAMMAARDENGNPTWQPNSIRVPTPWGTRFIPYSSLGPISVRLGAIANFVEQMDYAEGKVDDNVLKAAGRATGETITDAWYLQNVARTFEAMKKGTIFDAAGNTVLDFGERYVPDAALANQLRQHLDPVVREPRNPLEDIANRVPFASQLVPPRINPATGEPLERPRDIGSALFRSAAPGEPDLINEALASHNLGVSEAPKTITQKKFTIDINDDEQRQYTIERGKAVAENVQKLIDNPRYDTWSYNDQREALQKAVSDASADAAAIVWNSIPGSELDTRHEAYKQREAIREQPQWRGFRAP